jgi:hypothetical protein
MATTYTLISSVTVGSGGAANIEFTSIPATYTDLQMLFSVRSNRASNIDQIQVQLNGSTSNDTSRDLNSDGATAGSNNLTNFILSYGNIGNNSTSNTFGNASIYIPNYAGSSNKSMSLDGVGENNASGTNSAEMGLVAGLWSDSSAITSIKLICNVGTGFVQYSTAYLYGISNA